MSEIKCYVKRTDSDITHWKYIKREKKNGKWKYYYKKNAINSNNSGIKNVIKDKLGYDEKERLEASEANLKKRTDEFLKAEKDLYDKYDGYIYGFGNQYETKYKEEFAKLYAATEHYMMSKESYNRTPIGKIDNFKKEIDSGKNFVEALISTVKSNKKSNKQSNTVQINSNVSMTFDNDNKHELDEWNKSYREDFRKTSNAKSREKNVKNKKVATIKRRGEGLGSSKPQR